MSWLATKYAWKCRDDRVKGSVRLVLLAIALRVKKHFISTEPTSLATLKRLTFLSDDQVRRCLDTLEVVGEMRRVRRGKRAIYAMAKMAGPLFVETPQDAVFFEMEKTPQDAAFSARKNTARCGEIEKTPQVAGKKHRKLREKNTASCGAPVRTYCSSEDVRTEVLTTTTAGAAAEALAFLEWWTAAYALYNDGAQATSDLETDAPVVVDLLNRRPFARLQLMSIVLWHVRPAENQWIADSDRGLRVLRHKADWLDQYVSRLPAWWRECPHAPKCIESRQCDARSREAATG